MVTMTAVDGRIGTPELQRIGRLVQTLPVFKGFDPERLTHVTQECGEILQVDEGLEAILGLVSNALPANLAATAYALAVEVAVSDRKIWQEEIRYLARLDSPVAVGETKCQGIVERCGCKNIRERRAQLVHVCKL